MTHLTRPLFLVALGLCSVTSLARELEGARQNPVLLNGAWEFAFGDGSESAETPAGQRKLHWQQVELPGTLVKWSQEAARQTKFVWARRTFDVTPAQARGLAVLRWNRIANGAAFINGRMVGENEPTGPFQVIVPAGVLRPGENQIVLKVRGPAAVRKRKSGNALIPAGFGVGLPEVTDDVWIDFADRAYRKWVLAIPDLAGSRVKVRVTPSGADRLDDLTIVAQVKPWPDGKIMGEGQSPARLVPDPDPLGGEHFFVDVPMPGFRPWTYPVAKWSFDFALKADSIDKVPVQWKLPDKEGRYWLTARMTGLPGRPVLSQRFVRAISPPTLPEGVKRREFVVLGGDHAAQAFFKSQGLLTSSNPGALVPAASGSGRIVFAQLDLKGRLDRSEPNYDPVAERVLLNVLDRGAH